MATEIVVVCKCPACDRTYRQSVKSQWVGASRKVSRNRISLYALCEQAGQGQGEGVWVGYAYCSECALRRCPPSLKSALSVWLTKGEQL